MKIFYTALVHKDNEHYGVSFPDIPGCISGGDSLDDVVHQAEEALASHIECMLEEGYEIPSPTPLGQIASDPEYPEIARMLVGVELPGRTVRINITIDEALLAAIDKAAKSRGASRSGFLAEAARREIRYG